MALRCGVACSPPRGAGGAVGVDNYLIAEGGQLRYRGPDGEVREAVSGRGLLVGVSRGVGKQADVAASAAVRVLGKLYGQAWPRKPARVLTRYLAQAHDRLYGRTRAHGQLLGASLCALWAEGDLAGWVQVGDARVYLYRDGRMTQLSTDHTQANFARRNSRTPGVDAEQVAQRFIQGSSGLGDDTRLHLELGLDAGNEVLEPGDRLLLCTRGLWESVDPASLADVLANVPEPQAAAVIAMERALARGATAELTALVVGA